MNTQLVDSIVQMVGTLPPAERELVKQKLSILSDQEWSNSKTELTLEDRRAFLRKPLAQRQLILATQAQQMVERYQTSTEWRELMAGDIIDD
jgi:predicted NAD-dependent protein-ADP-ribosyltransferase YbiA (DUF1768 family)